MPDLFLSYSREDQAVARRFAEGFEREGLSVWWDQALNPGEAFDQVTEEALAAAHAVIVLWSKHSVSSRWVRAEATQANAAGRLLPVMIEDCTRPIMFELTHTADLTQWKGHRDDPAWQAFLASVRRFVQRRGAAGSGLPALLEAGAPRPTLPDRLAIAGTALRTAAAGTGTLLRRHGGRLALALAGVAIGGAIVWALRPQATPEVVRFSIELPRPPDGLVPFLSWALRPTLSPDGRRIVYPVLAPGPGPLGSLQLWQRRLDQDEATAIPGSEGGVGPFFSPDGESVAFFTMPPEAGRGSAQLKVFDIKGNAVRVLADLKQDPNLHAGSWGDKGQIFFDRLSVTGVWQIPASGGEPEVFAPPGEGYGELAFPEALPGGDWVLYTAGTAAVADGSGNADIVAQNVATGERRLVLKGGFGARYLDTGHLVFARGGALYAIAFDARRVATRGREVRVVEGVANDENLFTAAFSLAASGSLAYVPGTALARPVTTGVAASVVHVTRAGETRALSAEPRDYFNPRMSPDGSKVAVEVAGSDGNTHIWIMDVQSGEATQLTFEGDDAFPVWTADAREVLFTSRRGEQFSIWRKAADGSGEARHVLDGASPLLAPSDVRGNTLVYQDLASDANRDVFTFDLTAGDKPRPLLATPADESAARVSPDGKWVAYMSAPRGGEAAAYRIYVRPFPDAGAGGQRAISEGGTAWVPHWSPAGDEILYFSRAPDNSESLWSATVVATPTTITPTGRRKLFEFAPRLIRVNHANLGNFYDVSPKDGNFIALATYAPQVSARVDAGADPAAVRPPRLNVVLNWSEELKRLVPVQ